MHLATKDISLPALLRRLLTACSYAILLDLLRFSNGLLLRHLVRAKGAHDSPAREASLILKAVFLGNSSQYFRTTLAPAVVASCWVLQRLVSYKAITVITAA